jgi:ATP-dependent helicase HrpB
LIGRKHTSASLDDGRTGNMTRSELPIHDIEQPLCDALKTHRRIVLSAPTGSGKSTQVPQMLLDRGFLATGQVTVLQPRRLPARMLAGWVAQQRGVKLGGEVGYQMRLDSVISAGTRICYATEGVLLRRMLDDPMLPGVRAIVFDEFHERHLYGDISLARALDIQESARPDLIIVVMSATLDVDAVQRYLAPCAVLASAGRAFPVAIEYLAKPAGQVPLWDLAARELQRLMHDHPQGDALIFMPGVYEINRTVHAAREALGSDSSIFPLHGQLPPAEQDAAVARQGRRKVVVATNVAETSLTIDGVRLVIDSGLARVPRYDPHRGINTLRVEKISRAAADQRAGRAGRTAPGHALRLWTMHEHAARQVKDIPEVKRLDLAEVILTLKAGGVIDSRAFRWLEPPDARALERAETLLDDLGALDQKSRGITALGRRMLAFPLHPRYARMLLAGHDYGCARPVALIAALTQGRDLLLRGAPNRFEDNGDDCGGAAESDFFLLMRAWRFAERNHFDSERCRRAGINAQAARQVGPLLEHFLRIAEEEGLDLRDRHVDRDAVRRCLLLGFSDQLGKRLDEQSQRCALVHGRRGLLARESVVTAPLFVVGEAREVESGGGKERNLNVLLSLATAVEEAWLRELYPGDFREGSAVAYDPALRRVVARQEKYFRDLLLDQSVCGEPPLDQAAALLAREVAAGRLVLDKWDASVEQWLLRLGRLRAWMPELGLPAIGEEDRLAMLELVCHGALSAAEIKNRPVLPVMKSWLSREQQSWVETYAPERITLPRGRAVKVAYSVDAPPTVGARIQDLYGVSDGLWIADRRVPVRIEVLAPSNRPVQVTENLSVFWRETYPKLKAQLQRRYPKHEWR